MVEEPEANKPQGTNSDTPNKEDPNADVNASTPVQGPFPILMIKVENVLHEPFKMTEEVKVSKIIIIIIQVYLSENKRWF